MAVLRTELKGNEKVSGGKDEWSPQDATKNNCSITVGEALVDTVCPDNEDVSEKPLK